LIGDERETFPAVDELDSLAFVHGRLAGVVK